MEQELVLPSASRNSRRLSEVARNLVRNGSSIAVKSPRPSHSERLWTLSLAQLSEFYSARLIKIHGNMKAFSLTSCLSLGVVFLLNGLALADECQPHTWEASMKALNVDNIGKINCRYETTTKSKVNDKTCSSIAKKYQTTTADLTKLNPDLGEDCNKSIKPMTTYCVKGCTFFQHVCMDMKLT